MNIVFKTLFYMSVILSHIFMVIFGMTFWNLYLDRAENIKTRIEITEARNDYSIKHIKLIEKRLDSAEKVICTIIHEIIGEE